MKRYKVIACEIATRELYFCASQSNQMIDFSFMSCGLHSSGSQRMQDTLQEEIDKVDSEKYDAILLCYGLCGGGVVGLHATVPLIIPKAHDCTTFFLGSKERYTEFFYSNKGTFVYTPGWIERMTDSGDGLPSVDIMGKPYAAYVEQYGEETAKYIWDVMGGKETAYNKIALINTRVGNTEYYRNKLHEKANQSGWAALEIDGNTALLQKLLNGDWNDNDFTVIPPGNKIEATNDENIIGYAN